MNPNVWWIVSLAVVLGHFGLMLGIYNRINGFGLSRKLIKRLVKLFFLFTVLFPPIALAVHFDLVSDLWQGRPEGLPVPTSLLIYSCLCLAAWLVLGIPWLLWRPVFGLEWIRARREIEVVDVEAATGTSLARSAKCKVECRLPLNQIFELAIERIELPVVGMPAALDGYRIAHLSDIHLTGDVYPDFSKHVVQRASEWSPDMMTFAGDIIDDQECVGWLTDIFTLTAREKVAPDGCYFVLGNHDTRINDPNETRQAMIQAGWTDLGGRSMPRHLRGIDCRLIGNEFPWFDRPELSESRDEAFRLLLSHSPDQLGWARQHNVSLMLAGHTHGGQGRLPLIGPLLSPSFHGSRYASGDFYKPPTTLHVSRGLAGTHLMRIHCRPELSLLTLRATQSDGGDT
ncbi:MAG: metallophosphoesterase [Rubripirellula sp.]